MPKYTCIFCKVIEVIEHITNTGIIITSVPESEHGRTTRSATVKHILLPPTNEVWGKVMFLHLSFCSRGICIRGGGADPPSALWNTVNKRWYASYWNAFLLSLCPLCGQNIVCLLKPQAKMCCHPLMLFHLYRTTMKQCKSSETHFGSLKVCVVE